MIEGDGYEISSLVESRRFGVVRSTTTVGAIATSLFCRSKGGDFYVSHPSFLCSMTLNRLTRDL